MKQNENIFDYIARVQELKNAIIDGECPDEDGLYNIEHKAAISFVNGLPPDLMVRVKLEQCHSLEANIVAAIQLSKTMEIENIRRRPQPSQIVLLVPIQRMPSNDHLRIL